MGTSATSSWPKRDFGGLSNTLVEGIARREASEDVCESLWEREAGLKGLSRASYEGKEGLGRTARPPLTG